MTAVRAIRGSRPKKTPFGYRVWPTGKTFACHAWSPWEWARSHGFETAKEAEWWGMDAIVQFRETAEAYGLAVSVSPVPGEPPE